MAASLAFGSYIAASSPVHDLNAQVKIILACAFSLAVFFVETWAGMLVVVATVAGAYLLAHVQVGHALRGLVPVLFILIFTIVVHAFSISLGTEGYGASSQVGSLGLTQQWVIAGSFGVTFDGLACGVFFALRIALLVAVCSLLTFTTSMVALTDGMLKLMSPLRRLKVPVDDIAMMISIALRFIPTTAQEAQAVQLAQKARCADFEGGNVLTRTRAWVPVLVPLFVRLFRRADELAEAMDARCYSGGVRTHAHEDACGAGDIAILVCGLILLAALCVFL